MASPQETLYPAQLHLAPDLEPEISYTIPFDWGTFRVSEAAHQDSGMGPLNADTLEGSSPDMLDDPNRLFRTDIWMLSGDEVKEATSGSEETPDEPGNLLVHPDGQGMSLIAWFDKGPKELASAMAEKMLGMADEANEDQLRNMEEQISQEVPQLFLAALGDSIERGIQPAIADLLRDRDSRRLYRALALFGGVSLAGGGLVLGLGIPETVETKTHVDDFLVAGGSLAVEGAIGVFYLHQMRKRYLGSYRRVNQEAEADAGVLSRRIARQIYEAYSTDHFDKKHEGWLDEKPHPDTPNN